MNAWLVVDSLTMHTLYGRLRLSSVLVVGARGLGAELCKNVVLAGVRSVTVLDHALLTPANLGSRFLGRADGVNVRNSLSPLHSHVYTHVHVHLASGAGCGAAASPQS